MRRVLRRGWLPVITAAIVASATTAAVAVALPDHAGPHPDGTSVTTYGWKITPAGRQVKLGEKPFGAVLSPDGSRLYAAAGGNDKVRVYDNDAGRLTERGPITMPKGSFPSGVAVTADGRRLYVAGNGGGGLSSVDTATGKVLGTVGTGPNPFTAGLSGDGRTAYVSDWGTDTVSAVDTATLTVRRTLKVGSHPTSITRNPATGEMYVAVTDADKIVGIDPGTDAATRTIELAPYRNAPVGTSPQGMEVSRDGRTLYVANAGNNDVAVVRLAAKPHQRDQVTGLIPTGWYPTTVTLTRDGSRLLVTNAKGLGAGPNPGGPDPTKPGVDYAQYSGSMVMGTLSDIRVPGRDELERYTRQVRTNDRFDAGHREGDRRSVVPVRPGDPSPIKHVVYVVKENRTYDQVFGSLGKGNGDPSLNLFGDESAPNQRKLARDFVTLDNFYVDGAVSSDGWEWATASESNSYNEHLWPVAYGGRGRGDRWSSSGWPTTTPPGPLPGCRRRGRWWPTTIWPSDGSWTRCRTVPTGRAPRSSSPRTTRRTAPITSTPTAPRRWS
jgi:YVTN family beta-propeller protein